MDDIISDVRQQLIIPTVLRSTLVLSQQHLGEFCAKEEKTVRDILESVVGNKNTPVETLAVTGTNRRILV